MNNFIQSCTARALANKHTTGAGIVFFGTKYALKLALCWFPHHAPQIEQTAAIFEDASLAYGFVMSGDSHPQPPKQT